MILKSFCFNLLLTANSLYRQDFQLTKTGGLLNYAADEMTDKQTDEMTASLSICYREYLFFVSLFKYVFEN